MDEEGVENRLEDVAEARAVRWGCAARNQPWLWSLEQQPAIPVFHPN
jgi:hypothetical protein